MFPGTQARILLATASVDKQSLFLQGRLLVFTRRDGAVADIEERSPFYLLGLDLPAAPLFSDALQKNIIPQVPLHTLLAKYDGVNESVVLRQGHKKYTLEALPPYLIFHVKRFQKVPEVWVQLPGYSHTLTFQNNFFVEKNPTIVTFPLRGLDLSDVIPLPSSGGSSVYDLVANVCHDGTPGNGHYRTQVLHSPDGLWYEAHDLAITEVLPQQVAMTEAYLQIWRRRDA